jgi:pimeloyl-ACP methyl ester carboxylesterase
VSASPLTVVLVHGAGSGAWIWEAVCTELDRRAVAHRAVDLPTVGEDVDPKLDVHSDAAFLRSVLDEIDGPILLCGNSYGGVVITEAAAAHDRVVRLVYLAGFMPDHDDDLISFMTDNSAPGFPQALVMRDDGLIGFDPTMLRTLAFQQAPAEAATRAAARVRPLAMAPPSPPTVTGVAWRAIPSTYVVCGEDRALLPEAQRRWARERATESVELPFDHCPEVSHPVEVAELLTRTQRHR